MGLDRPYVAQKKLIHQKSDVNNLNSGQILCGIPPRAVAFSSASSEQKELASVCSNCSLQICK